MNPKDVPAGMMDHMIIALGSRVHDSSGYLNSPVVVYQGLKRVPDSPFTMLPDGYIEYVKTALKAMIDMEV